MRQIEEHANPAVNKVLVGNKCEMPADQREVTKERGQVSSATLWGSLCTHLRSL